MTIGLVATYWPANSLVKGTAMRGREHQICVLRDTQNEIIEAAGSLKGRWKRDNTHV